MMNYKAFALATVLSLSVGGVAIAEDMMNDLSATSALSSASSISFQTVPESEIGLVMAGSGLASELVDLDSLKARIQNNAKFLAALESYGSTVEDIVGINATSETDVTILVRG